MKKSHLNILFVVLIVISNINLVLNLGNQCNIKYCSSCNPKTNFCNECDLPYKPGYANQTICTRCANNCAVCQKPGNDSKGRCLSCQANYNYELDDHCDIFYIWIYVVVIASYVVFIIILFIVFCYIKRRKQRNQNQWFQGLKHNYNKVQTNKISLQDFDRICQQMVQLLKQSSSYNSLKFKDRDYEKAIKIKQVTLKEVKNQTHIKKLKIKGFDNSEFEGTGYVFVPQNDNKVLKLWFAKNYKRKVFSEQISKIIIYESQLIQVNKIQGRWYYYDAKQISGTWMGMRQQMHLQNINQPNANNPNREY